MPVPSPTLPLTGGRHVSSTPPLRARLSIREEGSEPMHDQVAAALRVEGAALGELLGLLEGGPVDEHALEAHAELRRVDQLVLEPQLDLTGFQRW